MCSARAAAVGGTQISPIEYPVPAGCEPVGEGAISSEAEFRAHFSCHTSDGGAFQPDSGLSFSAEQLAVVYDSVVWVLDSADGGVVFGTTEQPLCGGARPPDPYLKLFRVPARGVEPRIVSCTVCAPTVGLPPP